MDKADLKYPTDKRTATGPVVIERRTVRGASTASERGDIVVITHPVVTDTGQGRTLELRGDLNWAVSLLKELESRVKHWQAIYERQEEDRKAFLE